MVVDPLGRFAYVANLVSDASDPSTISMYTINPTTGMLTPTTPATVPTGLFPQGIAIDPLGRFVYTANSDDSSVSMFTINQTTGVLTPTTPASVSTLIPGELVSKPGFLTVDPTGRFLYLSAPVSNGSACFHVRHQPDHRTSHTYLARHGRWRRNPVSGPRRTLRQVRLRGE